MRAVLASLALFGLFVVCSPPARAAGVSLFHAYEIGSVGVWESESFSRASSGWRVGGPAGPLATAGEIATVLANLQDLEIHAACSNTDLGGLVLFCGFGVSNISLGGVMTDSFTDPDQASAGWLQRLDGSHEIEADWSGDGGEPGGYIGTTNTSLETLPVELALLAPNRYLGNQLSSFTSGLTFQFQAFADNQSAFVSGGSFIMLTGVPEPATFTLLAMSLVVLAWVVRRRRLAGNDTQAVAGAGPVILSAPWP